MISPAKIVVIGGNAAGPAAAAKAKRINSDTEVILIEKSPYISTGSCELSYVLSGEIEDVRKIVFFDEKSFFEKKGVKVLCNTTVQRIDRSSKELIIRSAVGTETISYEKLIIATGSSAREIPGVSLASNFSNLKNVSDLLYLKEQVSKSEIQKVAVLGAGYIGLETTEALAKLGTEVTIFELTDLPLPGAEPEIRELVKELILRNGVEFIRNTGSAEYIEHDGKIESVKFDGRFIDIDFVVGAAGFQPNNSLAKIAGLRLGTTGGLTVDSKLKTSDPNIYAAGDCIEITEFVTGKPQFIPVAPFAHESGHVAGENAAGGNAYLKPKVKNIAVKIFDRVYTTVGLTESEAKAARFNAKGVSVVANNLIKIFPGSSKIFGKIVWDEYSNRILGASFFGGKEAVGYADLISIMIRNKINARSLSEADYNYTPPLAPFVNILSILGRKIKGQING